jgi:hypothetical protein
LEGNCARHSFLKNTVACLRQVTYSIGQPRVSLNKHIHNPYLLALVTDNNAGQSFESSIVRVRVMRSEGWCFGCIVADETKSKRLLMENRFVFDWLTTRLR